MLAPPWLAKERSSSSTYASSSERSDASPRLASRAEPVSECCALCVISRQNDGRPTRNPVNGKTGYSDRASAVQRIKWMRQSASYPDVCLFVSTSRDFSCYTHLLGCRSCWPSNSALRLDGWCWLCGSRSSFSLASAAAGSRFLRWSLLQLCRSGFLLPRHLHFLRVMGQATEGQAVALSPSHEASRASYCT